MAKKDKKTLEDVVEEVKEEGIKVEVTEEPAPVSKKTCGHGNTDFCKFCGPL